MSADFPWGIVVCGEPRGAWRKSALFLCSFMAIVIPINYMKSSYFDVLLNVIIPILLGSLFYLCTLPYPYILRFYIPDALWAYAFTSIILIIWERVYNILWLSIIVVFFCVFELLQFLGILPGTGDLIDVLTYCISFLCALLLNLLITTKK